MYFQFTVIPAYTKLSFYSVEIDIGQINIFLLSNYETRE